MTKPLRTLLLCTLVAAPPVSAAVIVDTGPGRTITSGVGGFTLSSSQWLAAEFTLPASYAITDVQGWIGIGLPNGDSSTGRGTTAIYSDGGDVPGTELFSTPFTTADSASSWDGASGLNWLLDAGTYWVAFEVRAGQTLSDAMVGGAPNPLDNEAYYSPGNGAYLGFDSFDLGIRIFGDPAQIPPPPPPPPPPLPPQDPPPLPPTGPAPPPGQVPEPGSLALFGVAFAALGVVRRVAARGDRRRAANAPAGGVDRV